METPIIVRYPWSADEALLVNGLHMRFSPQGKKAYRRLRIAGIIFICTGAVFLCAIGGTPEKTKTAIIASFFILLGAAYLVLGKYLFRWAARKSYAKHPAKDLPVTYEFSDEKFSVVNAVSSSEMQWRVVGKILRTEKGFLLYVTDTQIHWLPVHGFETGEAVEHFATLARGKTENYKDVR